MRPTPESVGVMLWSDSRGLPTSLVPRRCGRVAFLVDPVARQAIVWKKGKPISPTGSCVRFGDLFSAVARFKVAEMPRGVWGLHDKCRRISCQRSLKSLTPLPLLGLVAIWKDVTLLRVPSHAHRSALG